MLAYRGHESYRGHDPEHSMSKFALADRNSRYQSLVQSLESRLVGSLRDAGFEVDLQPAIGDAEGDFIATKGAHRYVIALKVSRESRKHVLQAMLADALLRSRYA